LEIIKKAGLISVNPAFYRGVKVMP